MSSGAPAGAAAPAGGPRHITEHPHMPRLGRSLAPPRFSDDHLVARPQCLANTVKEDLALAEPTAIAWALDREPVLRVLRIPVHEAAEEIVSKWECPEVSGFPLLGPQRTLTVVRPELKQRHDAIVASPGT